MPGDGSQQRGPECTCRSMHMRCDAGLSAVPGEEMGQCQADGVFVRCRGKLVKSPGAVTCRDGKKVCRLEIDVDKWTLVALAFDGLAEKCAAFRRGRRVDVAGRLVVTPWQTGRGTQRETIRAEVTQATMIDE